ncbi:MAG: hypothetical protein ABW049_11700 [Spongiibacteraceae bacterium]
MLSDLDESLLHQVALPMSRTATSDHRFYDRVFFACFDPKGSASVMLGMGVYKNMNVIDGFACVVRNGKQHNVRASRLLRPNLDSEVGPIRFAVIKPFRELRFSIDRNESDVALDLVWTATIDPFLESDWEGNRKIVNGRIATDTQRFDGVGRWNGWIEVAGERIEVKDWCGNRDHSWGSRGGVGGYEPVNGPSEMLAANTGFFLGYFVYTDGDKLAGYTLWTENEKGRYRSMEGAFRWDPAEKLPDQLVHDLSHEFTFPPASRQYDHGKLLVTLENGAEHTVEFTKPILGTVLKGYGGHGEGFKDKKGFGCYRGELLVEHDIYDLDDPLMRQLPVEQPLSVTIDGKAGGWGIGTVLAVGELPQVGLRRQSKEEMQRYSIAVDNVAPE